MYNRQPIQMGFHIQSAKPQDRREHRSRPLNPMQQQLRPNGIGHEPVASDPREPGNSSHKSLAQESL
jgi:hypothetical protein